MTKTSSLASITPHHARTLRYALQVLQLRHTLGPGVDDQFHVAVVRDKLTRNLAALFPDVLDEVQAAFAEYVPAKEDGTSFRFVFPSFGCFFSPALPAIRATRRFGGWGRV